LGARFNAQGLVTTLTGKVGHGYRAGLGWKAISLRTKIRKDLGMWQT